MFRIFPDYVAQPATTADLMELLHWASVEGCPIVPRGAGSGMAGGNVGRGLLLDCTRLDGTPLAIDKANAQAWTGAGVTVEKLNAGAFPVGLRMPVVPSSGQWATVGGVLATNAAGARSYRFGSVRDWITAAEILLVSGERISLRRGDEPRAGQSFLQQWNALKTDLYAAREVILGSFPATRKNSSGYALDAFMASGDLLDLVIGSEGTLGIVVEATWRLEPLPAAVGTARIDLAQLDDLPRVLDALDQVHPVAVELLDRTFLEFVAERGTATTRSEAVLLMDVEGEPGTVLVRLREIESLGKQLNVPVTVAWSAEEASRLWAVRHGASPRLAQLGDNYRSLQIIEDGAVSRDRLGEYIRAVRAITARHHIPAILFGHAGDGHVHVNLVPDLREEGWLQRVRWIYDEVMERLATLGGTPSGEHGDGRLRCGVLPRYFGPETMELFGRVKRLFDPSQRCNPGVILGNESPWSDLKVTETTTDAMPSDIALALRDIEREGGYGRARIELATPPSAD